jgi:predicted RNase H-like nuclease
MIHSLELGIPDTMDLFEEITRHRLLQGVIPTDNLYSPAELDALVSAYTAWVAALHPENTLVLGDIEEGTSVLPVAELKPHY